MSPYHAANGLRGRHLDFPRDRLYGREDQLKQLLQAYERLGCAHRNGQSMAEMVLIAGYSGTGKSSLVYKFRDMLNLRAMSKGGADCTTSDRERTLQPSCWFISGTFEELKTDPFSVLGEAFSMYCLQLVNSNDEKEVRRVANGVKKVVGKEGKVLTDLIPQLTRLVGAQPDASFNSSKTNAMNRLKFLFESFVEVICCGDYPLILFLDDLQRADTASLDLLFALMTSPIFGKKLMLIGSFRCNEVKEDHPLAIALDKIEQRRQDAPERLRVPNLTVEAMNQFLSDTLSLDSEETLSLAYAVYVKTEGNIFYTIQLLEQLNEKQALRYDSCVGFRWVWNVDRINQEIDLADNVVDVLTARMTILPLQLQKILSAAALIGKSFDLPIIEDFMATHEYGQPNLEESTYYDYCFVELVDMAVEERLLESGAMGSETYRFAHDRIQQAACSLLPSDKKQKLRKLIGKFLAKRAFVSGGEDWMMFVATDHLNATLLQDEAATEQEILDLAGLNLTVGERAVSLSGFIPASSYFQFGMKALGRLRESPWKSHYQLTLELFRAASSSELSIGDFDLGWNLAHQLLNNAEMLSEKLSTYISMVDALSQRARFVEAMQLVVEALELLGECPNRRRLFRVLKNYRVVRRWFRKYTDDEILAFPVMTDPNKLKVMELLCQLNYLGYMTKDMTLFGVANSRLLRLAFEVGLCGPTALALTGYGILLSGVGRFQDPEGARRMGVLARETMRLTDGHRFDALSLHCIALFIDPWHEQLSSAMDIMHNAHICAMNSGDFVTGFRAFLHTQVTAYGVGVPLAKIAENCRRMMVLMDQYSVDCVRTIFDEFQVLVLSLNGSRTDGEWREPHPDRANSLTGRVHYSLGRMQLAYFFEDMSMADLYSRRAQDLVLSAPHAMILVSLTLFFSSLVALKKAQETGQRKYWTRVRKLRKRLSSLTKTRGLNILHKYYIVEAQYLAILPTTRRRNQDKVRAAFDKAISAASKSGFTQDVAIANELAGDYFLGVNDKFWAKHYLNHAYQEYQYWKAHAKVQHLLVKHNGLIDTVVSLYNSTPFMRSNRIQGEACKRHMAVNLESLQGSSITSGKSRYSTSRTSGTSKTTSAAMEESRSSYSLISHP